MIRVVLFDYFLGCFRGLGDPEVAVLTIILSGGMIFKLLALCYGEDALMEQLAGLIYYTTPISKGPRPEAEHTDFIMYLFQTASHRRGPMSLRPILGARCEGFM